MLPTIRSLFVCAALIAFELVAFANVATAEEVDYGRDVAPLLRKYCAGCHNATDPAGALAMDTFADFSKGGEHGAAFSPGSADTSRMIRLMTSRAEPKMPPADEAQPTTEEVELLKKWIDAGAKGPSGESLDPADLPTPRVAVTGAGLASTNHMALSPQGNVIALAGHGIVELRDWPSQRNVRKLSGARGAVNYVAFDRDGKRLVAACGEPGVFGQAVVWDVATGEVLRTLKGHRDALLSACFSPNGQLVATGSYDQSIVVWDVEKGAPTITLDGHNGAIYEVAFHPTAHVLASASGDRTVKIWNLADGRRLETLNQATKELYCLAFSPDGKRIVAGGVDNRIRLWGLSASMAEGTNPLLVSQFAHETPLLRLTFSPDGATLVSTAEDFRVKVWNAADVSPRATLETQPDWATGASITSDNTTIVIGRRDGSLGAYPVGAAGDGSSFAVTPLPDMPPAIDYGPQPAYEALPRVAEVEPNEQPATATALAIPAVATGRMHRAEARLGDVDLYRFSAKAGEQWVVETRAGLKNFPTDTKIEILDLAGRPIPRLLLRAVRDTEVEFRSVSSDQSGARLLNWEEMLLNEYVWLNGDVMKHYRQRRGPDAENNFYPETGLRHGQFDTTPRAHALGERGYVVVPLPLGSPLADNGLPVFTLNYENDDDGKRKLGRDSKLTFTAPVDGDYLVRVTDVRNGNSDKHEYELIIRRPQPDFTASVGGGNATVNASGAKALTFNVDRIDTFNGPVRFEVENLPPGYTISGPILVQEGLHQATATLVASPFAPIIDGGWDQTKVTAIAEIAGKEVRREAAGFGKTMTAGRSKLVAHLERLDAPAPTYETPREWKFKPLKPTSVVSFGGASLRTLEDSSVLAEGDNPDSETYVIVGRTRGAIRSLRLETLGHEGLPAGSPGRGDGNGNFVLSDVKISIAPVGKPNEARPVKVARAMADFSQPGHSAELLLDGDPATGWAIAEPTADGKFPVKHDASGSPNHQVTFDFAEPVDLPGGAIVMVTLEQAGRVPKHNIGRFRIALAGDEPVEQPQAPAVQELTIAPGGTASLKVRVERYGFDDRINFEVFNLPHGIIVEDIGLNGILIPEGQTERTIFLRAEPWVGEQSRPFFAQANVEGNQCSRPVLLHVRRDRVASRAPGP